MTHTTQSLPDEPTCQQRIDALRETKAEPTVTRVALFGPYDTDDRGYIPWSEPRPTRSCARTCAPWPRSTVGWSRARCARPPIVDRILAEG